MNILFNRNLIFVFLVCHSCFSYAVNQKDKPQQDIDKTKEYSSSIVNLSCSQCNNNVNRHYSNWYPKNLLDEATKKKLPNFICGAYIEPKNYTADTSSDTINLTANYFSLNENQVARLWQNVTINFKNYYIECEQAKIDKAKSYYNLAGNVTIRQPGVLLIGDKATISEETQQAEIINSDFILYDTNSHGHADSIKANNAGFLELKNAYYTSCPPGKKLWSICGKSITYNNKKKTLVVTNAKFKVYNTPILWLPYLTFSTDENQSKTGFLMPNINFTSSHKLDLTIPFYWQISNDYDTTITLKYLQNKGVLINNEFRYLTKMPVGEHKGNLHTSLFTFPSNKAKKNNQDSSNYYISYQHESTFQNNASLLIDYNKAKNHKYFTELKLEKHKKKYIEQKITASWSTPDENSKYKIIPKVEFYDVQQLDQNFIVPYKKAPSLSLQCDWAMDKNFHIETNLDYTKFINNNSQLIDRSKLEKYGVNIIDGDRFYSNITANYKKNIGKFYFKPEVTVTQLHYNLDNINSSIITPYLSSVYTDFNQHNFTNKPNQIGAGFNIKYGAKLVKNIVGKNNSWKLTFKPAVKYFFSPYIKDQFMNPVFDSYLIKLNSYSSLWNNSRFAGKDRIADQNQLTLGISTKLTNFDNTITYSFNLGQIFYFADRKVWINPKTNTIYYADMPDLDLQQEQEKIQRQLSETHSPLIIDSSLNIKDKLKLQAITAIDTNKNKLNSLILGVDYCFFDKYSLKLFYNYEQRSNRFAKDINNHFIFENNTRKTTINNLNELGLSLYYPITNKITMISGLKYDIMNSKTTDLLAGIEYSNCCFQARLVANKWLDRSDNFYFPQERYRILLNFKFYGLSFTNGSYNSIISKLEDYTKFEI